MKNLIIAATIGLSILGSATAHAQSVTTYVNVKTDYSFPEFGFTQHNGAVTQGGITLSWENGVFADIWASQALNGERTGAEVDYTLGWAGTCGSLNCTVVVSYFDLPTPQVGDMNPDLDILRIRAQVSDSIEVDESDSIGWFVGVDELTGLLESTNVRAGTSWTHSFGNWSSTALVGATHISAQDEINPYWELSATRQFETWSFTMNVTGFDRDIDGHHTVAGIGVSRSW